MCNHTTQTATPVIQQTATTFSLCPHCQAQMDFMNSKIHKEKKNYQHYIVSFFKNRNVVIGDHGYEKAALLGIDLEDKSTQDLIFQSNFIEFQVGQFAGETKGILLNTLPDGSLLHFVILFCPNKEPRLVNVYNPHEGMAFKWSADGSKRTYLNSFRNCCPHPLDKEEWHNKKHHGIRHKKYEYQY